MKCQVRVLLHFSPLILPHKQAIADGLACLAIHCEDADFAVHAFSEKCKAQAVQDLMSLPDELAGDSNYVDQLTYHVPELASFAKKAGYETLFVPSLLFRASGHREASRRGLATQSAALRPVLEDPALQTIPYYLNFFDEFANPRGGLYMFARYRCAQVSWGRALDGTFFHGLGVVLRRAMAQPVGERRDRAAMFYESDVASLFVTSEERRRLRKVFARTQSV